MDKNVLARRLRLPGYLAAITGGVLLVTALQLMGSGAGGFFLPGLLLLAMGLLLLLLGLGLCCGYEFARKIGAAFFYLTLVALLRLLIFFFFGVKATALMMRELLQASAPALEGAASEGLALMGSIDEATLRSSLLLVLLPVALTVLAFKRCLDPELQGGRLEQGWKHLGHLSDVGVFFLLYALGQGLSFLTELTQLLLVDAAAVGLLLWVLVGLGCAVAACTLLWKGRTQGLVLQWAALLAALLGLWQASQNTQGYGTALKEASLLWWRPMLQYRTMDALLLLLLFSLLFYRFSKGGLLAQSPAPGIKEEGN